MDIRELVKLHCQWWRCENTAPLVTTYAPMPMPFGGMDVQVRPAEIVERKLANLAAVRAVPSDGIPVAFPDFGPAFLPAIAGAGFEYDGHTTWSIPCAASIRELTIPAFDRNHPIWRQFEALFRPLLANWSWSTYLPAATVMCGPMDILAAMLGPQTLALELYEYPELVEQRAMDAAKLFLDVFDAQAAMIRDAGLTEGMADWMVTWMPGRGVCFSEDFAALCGAEHFRRFFAPADTQVMTSVDTAYLHLHSGALACLEEVLAVPGLKALELSNDPAGPDIDRLIAAAQNIQEKGICLQFSNWEHPLSQSQINHIVDSLQPGGLKITLQAKTLAEAHELYERVKTMPVASQQE